MCPMFRKTGLEGVLAYVTSILTSLFSSYVGCFLISWAEMTHAVSHHNGIMQLHGRQH